MNDKLHDGKIFWDKNPCDGQDNYFFRSKFRYNKEPWLKDLLRCVANNKTILEIGCGQGTDALTICSLKKDGAYVGIDMSKVSVSHALRATEDLLKNATIAVVPTFIQGNAESLDFSDASFDCVYSLGVLHHTQNITAALKEIERVLKPGGVGIIALYKKFSPKLILANTVRSVFFLFSEKKRALFLDWLRKKNSKFWGTMLLEALGVPILNSYTRNEIVMLVKDFSNTTIELSGCGFPVAASLIDTFNIAGYMFIIKCNKAKIVE